MTSDSLERDYRVGAAVAQPLWRSALATIGSRAIDLPSRYGFHLLVAWRLGLVDAGAFYIVFSALTLAAGLGRLGIDRALTREVAQALALGQDRHAARLIRHGLLRIAMMSLAAALALAAAAPLLTTHLFDSARLTVPLLYAAGAIPFLCLSAGAAGALAGLHRVGLSQMIYSWLWPTLYCLVALVVPLTLERAMVFLVIATAAAAGLSFVLLWRLWPGRAAGEGADPGPERTIALGRLGWSLFTTEIVQLLLAALPALVLGALSTQAAVGAYAMAWRLALVLNLLTVAVAAMASPRFADASARGDVPAMRRTAAQSVGLVIGMGIAPLLVLAIAAPQLLGLFGAGFVEGTTALRLLLLGQLVLMLSATSPELLGMTGHEAAMQRINILAIAAYVPALAALSLLLGAEGAALANIVIALITAVGASWLGHRAYGFTPLGALAGRIRGRAG